MTKSTHGSIIIVNFFFMIICLERIKLLSTRIGWKSLTPFMTGEELWDHVSKLPKSADHCGKSSIYWVSYNWTKQSIFWEFPYWRKPLICHNLDVMHIEKNVCDQIIYTIMDIKGKTKDDVNARLDLAEHCKCQKLHVSFWSGRWGKSHNAYCPFCPQ